MNSIKKLQLFLVNFIFILLVFDSKTFSQDCGQLEECDCGTIARPPGLEIVVKPFKHNDTTEGYDDEKEYKHNSQVWYQCIDRNNLLVGNEMRRCDRGKWLGSVPRCAVNYLNQTELTSIEIHGYNKSATVSTMHLTDSCSNLGAFTPPITRHPENCLKWKIGEHQIWFLKLRHSVDVHYIRIKLYAEYLRHHWNNDDISFKVFLNNLWGIKCKLSNSNSINYEEIYNNTNMKNFLILEFLCEPDSIPIEENKVQAIYVNLIAKKNVKMFTLSFCDLRVYYFPKSCGEPDFPVSAQVRYFDSSEEFEQYDYVCKDNDHVLEGLQSNSHVRCGPNGKWMDEFPICVLKSYCISLKNYSVGNSVKVQYESTIISSKGEIFIPDGKFAQFSCHNQSNDNKSTYHLEGISHSICRNSQWIGLSSDRKPNCILKSSVPLTTDSISISKKLIRILSGLALVSLISIVCLIIYMLVSSKKKKRKNVDENNHNHYDDNRISDNYEQFQHIYEAPNDEYGPINDTYLEILDSKSLYS